MTYTPESSLPPPSGPTGEHNGREHSSRAHAIASEKPLRIGEGLVQHNLLTDEQLRWALDAQDQLGDRLGDILQAFGMVQDTDLHRVLSTLWHVPFMRIAHMAFDIEMCRALPFEEASRFKCVPVFKKGSLLIVATTEQPTAAMKAALSDRYETSHILFSLTTEHDIQVAHAKIYSLRESCFPGFS